MLSLFLSGLVPWLLIMLLLQKQIQKNRFFTSPLFLFFLVGLVMAGILLLPVKGLPLIYWSASLMGCFSVPLIGVLLVVMIERFFSCTLFSRSDWQAVSLFGVVSALVLYPAALGLGHVDPYCWGWGHGAFFITIALLTLVLLLAKNRLAILLLLAIAAFDFQLQESTNLWDYLIDPVYVVIALLMSMRFPFKERQVQPQAPSLFVQ